MCGLCGVYSTNFASPEEKIFKRLLEVNVWRGEHSTGIIRVDEVKEKGKTKFPVRYQKIVQPSSVYLRTEAANFLETTAKDPDPLCFLGHTRHATKGEINKSNTHPFSFSRVTGMHNGTVNKTFKGTDKYGTDSEALYALINDVGLKKAVEEVNDFDSAYALQWIDRQARTLNFFRNDQRPLNFTYLFNGSTLVWSSDSRHLEFILDILNHTSLQGWKGEKEDCVFTLSPHNHLVIPLGGHASKDAELYDDFPKQKKTYYSSYSYGGHGYDWGDSVETGRMAYDHVIRRRRWYDDREWYEIPLGIRQLLIKLDKMNLNGTAQENKYIELAKEYEENKKKSLDLPKLPPSKHGHTDYGDFRSRMEKQDMLSLAWLRAGNTSGGLDQDLSEGVPFDDTLPFGKEPSDKNSERSFRGHNGKHLSMYQFEDKLSRGCEYCCETFDLNCPADWPEIESIEWLHEDSWLCASCWSKQVTRAN